MINDEPEPSGESEAEETERPRIKVTDRRLFDRRGNPRQPVETATAAAPGDSEQSSHVRTPGPETTGVAGRRTEQATATAEASEPAIRQQQGRPPDDAPGEAAAATSDSSGGDGEAKGADSGRRIVPPGGPSAAELPRDFSALVESQYFEAMLYLGAVRHPQSGQLIEDIDLAKYKIDLLAILQDKTEGNLTTEEHKLLEDLLYQLRMLYLQKTKAARP